MPDARFWEVMKATDPNKVRKMQIEKVIEYEQYFAEQLLSFGLDTREQAYRQQCQDRMDDLRSERQHRESMCLGRTTLWVAVLAVAVPMLLALVSHILPPRPQPSRTDLENSPPSLQPLAPTAVSQEPVASSKTATPSPGQSVTAQPSSTTTLPSASPKS